MAVLRLSVNPIETLFFARSFFLRNPTETIATPISTQSSSAHVEERDQERIPKPVSNGFENDCYAGDAGYQRLKLGAPLKLTIMGHFSSKTSHFQNEAKCKTLLVKMSLFDTGIKGHFHINNFFALILAL